MHIEFLVEEPSAEAVLRNLVPKLVGPDVGFEVHPFQGKPDLLRKLPGRLRGYKTWLPEDWRIVVLLDVDDDDCRDLRATLEAMSAKAGLSCKSTVGSGAPFQVLNRPAIEELEAWFFGDLEALHAAYPHVSPGIGNAARYRDPDAIAGGTWEALERELQRGGYYRSGLAKITAARDISSHMEPTRNRSTSFRVFCQGLTDLTR